MNQTPKKTNEESHAQRAEAKRAKSYAEFKAKYRNDPEGFVLDCFHWQEGKGPTEYQLEILRAIPAKKRVCVRGPHGLGKTALSSWLILWFALTRDGEDWKMPCTAGAWRQLQRFLWPEVHKWARSLRWEIVGRMPFDERLELQALSLKLSTGEAFAVASNKPDLIEGAHGDCLFYLYDESKAIPDATFDAAEGAFSNAGDGTSNEAFAVAFSTPGEPQGRFYDIQRRKDGFEDWWARAVTLEETIAANRVAKSWAEQRAKQWGRDSALFQRRVMGNFASDDESGVIPLTWIEQSQERFKEWQEAIEDDSRNRGELEALGIDVGGGKDPSVLAKLYRVDLPNVRRAIDVLEYDQSSDPLSIGSIAGRILNNFPALRTVVDAIGIGAGTLFDLRRSYTRVLGFVAGGAAKDQRGKDKTDKSGDIMFADNRSWAWWTMREMLDPANGELWALPDDDRLVGDLTAPKWREYGKGRIKVESKDELRNPKRLGRSTDAADAVIHTLYDEPDISEPDPKPQPRRVQRTWIR